MFNFGYVRGFKRAKKEGAKAVWGARALTRGRFIDMVWDRTQFCPLGEGGREDVEALKGALHDRGLTLALNRASDLLNIFHMNPKQNQEFTLYENDVLIVLGNTNASCGYLYLAAWLKPRKE